MGRVLSINRTHAAIANVGNKDILNAIDAFDRITPLPSVDEQITKLINFGARLGLVNHDGKPAETMMRFCHRDASKATFQVYNMGFEPYTKLLTKARVIYHLARRQAYQLLVEIILGKKRFLECQQTYKTEYERKFGLANGNDKFQILPPTARQLWAAIKLVVTSQQGATIQAVKLQASEKDMQHYHDGLSTEFKIRKGKGKIFIDNEILDYNADTPAKTAFYISPGGAHGFEAETETILPCGQAAVS